MTTLGDLRRLPLPDETPVVVETRTRYVGVAAAAAGARCVTCDEFGPRLFKDPPDPRALAEFGGVPRGLVTVVCVDAVYAPPPPDPQPRKERPA